ncbi:hypothetical protein TEQG_05671 [Trichophyton equinum CBS 127.97]|uniref:Uncharacterized protein n=1 Tax=Trichophyton equinum (strain ATCC MYA-4606 / CBS 127.97) TaxID=559882 RepID=F2PXQ9_TRIEC|nr:hypothetical protein TEQG_05671 [Trichophyton equinum CBS 127.97]
MSAAITPRRGTRRPNRHPLWGQVPDILDNVFSWNQDDNEQGTIQLNSLNDQINEYNQNTGRPGGGTLDIDFFRVFSTAVRDISEEIIKANSDLRPELLTLLRETTSSFNNELLQKGYPREWQRDIDELEGDLPNLIPISQGSRGPVTSQSQQNSTPGQNQSVSNVNNNTGTLSQFSGVQAHTNNQAQHSGALVRVTGRSQQNGTGQNQSILNVYNNNNNNNNTGTPSQFNGAQVYINDQAQHSGALVHATGRLQQNSIGQNQSVSNVNNNTGTLSQFNGGQVLTNDQAQHNTDIDSLLPRFDSLELVTATAQNTHGSLMNGTVYAYNEMGTTGYQVFVAYECNGAFTARLEPGRHHSFDTRVTTNMTESKRGRVRANRNEDWYFKREHVSGIGLVAVYVDQDTEEDPVGSIAPGPRGTVYPGIRLQVLYTDGRIGCETRTSLTQLFKMSEYKIMQILHSRFKEQEEAFQAQKNAISGGHIQPRIENTYWRNQELVQQQRNPRLLYAPQVQGSNGENNNQYNMNTSQIPQPSTEYSPNHPQYQAPTPGTHVTRGRGPSNQRVLPSVAPQQRYNHQNIQPSATGQTYNPTTQGQLSYDVAQRGNNFGSSPTPQNQLSLQAQRGQASSAVAQRSNNMRYDPMSRQVVVGGHQSQNLQSSGEASSSFMRHQHGNSATPVRSRGEPHAPSALRHGAEVEEVQQPQENPQRVQNNMGIFQRVAQQLRNLQQSSQPNVEPVPAQQSRQPTVEPVPAQQSRQPTVEPALEEDEE